MHEIKTGWTATCTQAQRHDPRRHAARTARIDKWMLSPVYTDEDADRTFVG